MRRAEIVDALRALWPKQLKLYRLSVKGLNRREVRQRDELDRQETELFQELLRLGSRRGQPATKANTKGRANETL